MNLEAFVRNRSRGNEQTLKLYMKAIAQFQGWLGTRSLPMENLNEYEAWLRKRYKNNSLSAKVAAVNYLLDHKGLPFRMRRPPKEYAANPKLITPDEYDELLARIQDSAERLVVRLLHDSLLRPSDVVTVRLADLADANGVLVIRRRTKKTGKVSESFLTKDTALELRAYVASQAITDYLFPVNGHPRHRTWPNVVLRKYGAEGVTPRTFRRTGATAWNDDLASLMSQGAWNDPKTILAHYRRDVHARHRSAFEGAIGKATDEDPDEPKGYA